MAKPVVQPEVATPESQAMLATAWIHHATARNPPLFSSTTSQSA